MGEKQNLMELGAMVVDYMVQRKKEQLLGSPAHHVVSAAHDLITPLTGIDLTVSSLKDDPNLTQVQKDQLENAARCVSAVKGICHDLLRSASRAQQKACCNDSSCDDDNCRDKRHHAYTGDGESGIVKIAKLADKISTVIEHHPKQVPVLLSVSPDVPSEIVSNDLILFRSALNLLTRACRTTTKGSIQFRISMDDNSYGEGAGAGIIDRKMILFTCQDTGPSVPLEDYPNLFKKPDDCHMPDTMSTDLGLYSVAQHMNHLGGDYGYSKQQGCVFWFRVPLFLPENNSTTPSGNAQREKGDVPLFPSVASELRRNALNGPVTSDRDPALPERTRTALVIEDTLVVRKTMSRCLTKLGFEVSQAENGFVGLQKLKDDVYDIVLCDFRKYICRHVVASLFISSGLLIPSL
jgi:hypothetical protein